MMKFISRLYHFLGGVSFAIILIASVAIFVIAGTILESKTESHRFAALYTYNHPFFALLLWGFFINILISALRRWPFKLRHIPFLITHTGLLMILGGVLVKHYYGTQGSMGIMEGSATQEIFLPDSHVLSVENRHSKAYIDLKQLGDVKKEFPSLTLRLAGYTPHSSEVLESWIKGNQSFIHGLKPFDVHDVSDPSQVSSLPISATTENWDIMALRSNQVEELAKNIYLNGLAVEASPTTDIDYSLDFDYSAIDGFLEPKLIANAKNEQIQISLQGPEALLNKNISSSYLGNLPFAIDLQRKPILLFIQDDQNDVYVFAFGKHGEVHSNIFRCNHFNSLISYDNGFMGYSAQLTFPSFSQSRFDKELASLNILKDSLREGFESSPISPPLEILKQACKKNECDFVDTCLDYLFDWDRSHQLLYSKEIPNIDWNFVPENELRTCYWMTILLPEIQNQLQSGKDFLVLLEEKDWPFLIKLQELRQTTGPCVKEEIDPLITAFIQQLHTISSQLPSAPEDLKNPLLFSAYLKLYNITYANIRAEAPEISEKIELECPLTTRHRAEIPLQKLEDNLPRITLHLSNAITSDVLSLTYDRYGHGLKWPALNGEYLLRFQPKYSHIPYRIRLLNARQINYANSSQPYSFESDLIITDTRNGIESEKTISMNNVHETWDGYRFYLASISPPSENAVKQIQIVVNHDPAKYILTYPGAIILTVGIVSLFWFVIGRKA